MRVPRLWTKVYVTKDGAKWGSSADEEEGQQRYGSWTEPGMSSSEGDLVPQRMEEVISVHHMVQREAWAQAGTALFCRQLGWVGQPPAASRAPE